MPQARAIISPSVAHGPYVVMWDIDGAVQDVALSVANLSAALDQAKTFLSGATNIVNTTKVTLTAQIP